MSNKDPALNNLEKSSLESNVAANNEWQHKYSLLQQKYDAMAQRLSEMESQINSNHSSQQITEQNGGQSSSDKKNEPVNTQEIINMKNEALMYSTCIDEIQNNLKYINNNLIKISNDAEDVRQYMQLNTLLIHGMKNLPDKNGIEFSEHVLEELKRLFPMCAKYLVPGVIDTSHPLPTRSGKKSVVIVKFVQRDIRNLLFFNKRELKGNRDGIAITEHLTGRNLALLGQVRDVFGYKNAWTSKCKIYVLINGRKHSVKNERDFHHLCETKLPHLPASSTVTVHNDDFLKSNVTNHDNNLHTGVSNSGRDRFGNRNLSRPHKQ